MSDQFPKTTRHSPQPLDHGWPNVDQYVLNNRIIALLAAGDYRKAWSGGLWRMNREPWAWDGRTRCRTIRVNGMTGLGDNIQYVRFIPLLYKFCEDVVLTAPPDYRPTS